MSKHTPGPWMPTLCDDGAWMVNTDGDIIVVGDNLSEANARLIAAAPDLLSVCREFILALGPDGYHPAAGLSATNRMRAAIDKAEGRS